MENYRSIKIFFLIFFGQDAEHWGNSYPEIVDSAIEFQDGVDDLLISDIDRFLREYPTNEEASQALNKITMGSVGDTASFPPTLIDFLAWLSAYFKKSVKSNTLNSML